MLFTNVCEIFPVPVNAPELVTPVIAGIDQVKLADGVELVAI